ncbi:MAG: hypothetical protein IPQ07_00445 [Myxococcales bacterium]|nr:hypothetical protein [Myxococcales bacterium]
MTLDSTRVLLAHIDIPPRLLASLVVLGIVLVIWFFKAVFSSASAPPVQAGAPPCPTCRGLARWYPATNQWHCDRCNRPVPAPGTQPMAGQAQIQGQMPGQMPGQPPINPYTGQPIAPQQMAPQGPTCQTCNGPGRWLAESNAWGCDRCRQLIQPR